LTLFDSSFEVISGHSPVPSENFPPRYKENGAATLLSGHELPGFHG